MDDTKREQLRALLGAVNAVLDSMSATFHTDQNDVWKYASFKTYLRKCNELIRAVSAVTPIDTAVDLYDLDRVPGSCDTIPLQQRELFSSAHANLSILKAYLENKIGIRNDRIQALTDFLQVNLRRAVF